LAGCASAPPPPEPGAEVAPAWRAPLPHGAGWSSSTSGGRSSTTRSWRAWSRRLKPSAHRSPAPARASPRRARPASAPTRRCCHGLDATASASRGRPDLALPVATTSSAGLLASWELDVFGGNRAGSNAAEARLAGAEATWRRRPGDRRRRDRESVHRPARLRGALAQVRLDADSRAETARLTGLSMESG
jgi:outer membrane protein TolC